MAARGEKATRAVGRRHVCNASALRPSAKRRRATMAACSEPGGARRDNARGRDAPCSHRNAEIHAVDEAARRGSAPRTLPRGLSVAAPGDDGRPRRTGQRQEASHDAGRRPARAAEGDDGLRGPAARPSHVEDNSGGRATRAVGRRRACPSVATASRRPATMGARGERPPRTAMAPVHPMPSAPRPPGDAGGSGEPGGGGPRKCGTARGGAIFFHQLVRLLDEVARVLRPEARPFSKPPIRLISR